MPKRSAKQIAAQKKAALASARKRMEEARQDRQHEKWVAQGAKNRANGITGYTRKQKAFSAGIYGKPAGKRAKVKRNTLFKTAKRGIYGE